ncbi:hypothetical protein SNEBB_002327 [Seison nebaliae]|nr:hypothetical protein SNEBB_002327 [Seison nebaliae]
MYMNSEVSPPPNRKFLSPIINRTPKRFNENHAYGAITISRQQRLLGSRLKSNRGCMSTTRAKLQKKQNGDDGFAHRVKYDPEIFLMKLKEKIRRKELVNQYRSSTQSRNILINDSVDDSEDLLKSPIEMVNRFKLSKISVLDNHAEEMKSYRFIALKYGKQKLKESDSYFQENYIRGRLLGDGNFGQIYEVKEKYSNRSYAIKSNECTFGAVHSNGYRMFKLNELYFLQVIPSHFNCVRYFDCWTQNSHLHILTELCEMNLEEFIYTTNKKSLDELCIWKYLFDIASALSHLHSYDVLHMDVKPANILLTHSLTTAKLGDFGIVGSVTDLKRNEVDGDSVYVAPEIYKGNYTVKSDAFSLGMLLLELSIFLNFQEEKHNIWNSLYNEEANWELKYLINRSSFLRRTIKGLLQFNVKKRISITKLFELKQFQKFQLIRKIFFQFFQVFLTTMQIIRMASYFFYDEIHQNNKKNITPSLDRYATLTDKNNNDDNETDDRHNRSRSASSSHSIPSNRTSRINLNDSFINMEMDWDSTIEGDAPLVVYDEDDNSIPDDDALHHLQRRKTKISDGKLLEYHTCEKRLKNQDSDKERRMAYSCRKESPLPSGMNCRRLFSSRVIKFEDD